MRAFVPAIAAALALAGCSLLVDVGDLRTQSALPEGGVDGGTDVVTPPPPPAKGFTIGLAQKHVTADPGDAMLSVTVLISRAADFADPVNVTFNALDPAAGVTSVTPLVLAGSTASGPIGFAIAPSAMGGDYTIQVLGQSGSYTSQASFGLRVGSLVAVATTDMSVAVPPFATAIDVKAWGGGGGGAKPGVYDPGGAGGGGGFASARIAVTGGATLDLVVGRGGGTSSGSGAGAGGGYSAVRSGGMNLVIAGGGGGGGYGGAYSAPFAQRDGLAGHATSGNIPCERGRSGTATAGGEGGGSGSTKGMMGASLLGGQGLGNSRSTGGAPGGGNGGSSGGGGGGGLFGGGGGGGCMDNLGGGGGGSGLVPMGGTLTGGNGRTPGGAGDPDHGGGSQNGGGPGYGGTGGSNQSSADTAGAAGRIVLRLAKP